MSGRHLTPGQQMFVAVVAVVVGLCLIGMTWWAEVAR